MSETDTGTQTRRASGFSLKVNRRVALNLLGIFAAFVVFEALTRADLVNPTYLPPASSVLLSTVGLLVDPQFLRVVGETVLAWAVGLGLAIAIAVPLGMMLGSFNSVYRASRTLVEFLRPIPSVALIPLALLLFGQGLQMKLSLIVYASVWPLLFNTIYGIHSVDPIARDTARVFGFGPAGRLIRVSLPSATPFIWTGIRISAAIALILAISAELLAGGAGGIGGYILNVQQAGLQRLVYAGTIVAGLLGIVMNWALVRGERRFLAWQPSLRSRDS